MTQESSKVEFLICNLQIIAGRGVNSAEITASSSYAEDLPLVESTINNRIIENHRSPFLQIVEGDLYEIGESFEIHNVDVRFATLDDVSKFGLIEAEKPKIIEYDASPETMGVNPNG